MSTPGKCDLPWKPLAQWNRDDLARYEPDPNSTKWLKLIIHPELSLAVAAYYRAHPSETPEKKVRCLAGKYRKQTDCDLYVLRAVARWFLRNYALFDGLMLYVWLLCRPGQRFIDRLSAFSEMLMPRVFVSVWIGMLAICGSSPWTFLEALPPSGVNFIIWSCLAFALVYRVMHIGRRSTAGFWAIAGRSVVLSGYGWACGWALFAVFAWLYKQTPNQKLAQHVWETYRLLMPSAGSAVGVVLQELWDDKPISEPL
jgi:hypothetical protein